MRPMPAAERYRPKGAPSPPRAHQQDLRVLQLELTLHAYFRHDQVARITQDFVVRERSCLLLTELGSRRHRSPGDAGDDRQRVSWRDRGGVLFQIADVLIVEIHVHETAQFAFIVEELLAQIGECRGQ